MLAQGIFPQAPFLIWLRRTQRGPDAKGLQIPWGLPLSWDRSQEGSLQDWDMAMHSQGDGRAKQEWGSAVSLELGAEGLSPGPLQVLLRAPSGEQLGFSGPRGCSWKTGYVMSITSGLDITAFAPVHPASLPKTLSFSPLLLPRAGVGFPAFLPRKVWDSGRCPHQGSPVLRAEISTGAGEGGGSGPQTTGAHLHLPATEEHRQVKGGSR